MSNSRILMGCPAPFLAEGDFPPTGGYLKGRFCAELAEGALCCLPCPLNDWVYSDSFANKMTVAYWLNVPSLVLITFILLTFIVLPPEVSHRHYLSVGLALSMIILHLAFIIPLGTKPNQCINEITPNDMYNSMSCAWSGALILMGAMSCAVWIMLRSIWTHLRVVWDKEQTKIYLWAAQIFGWGLPGLFLALCVGITGLSYRFGSTCVPNQPNAFVTWFGWLMAFGCLGAIFQFATFTFCLWIYLKDLVRGRLGGKTSTTATSNSHYTGGSGQPFQQQEQKPRDQRKLAWKRVWRVMKVQWRSMALCTIVSVLVVFYGVSVTRINVAVSNLSDAQAEELGNWALCLILHSGKKNSCPLAGSILGLDENALVATFTMAALIGTLTFLLMVRRSMWAGWWYLLRHPRRSFRKPSIGDEDFMVISPKHKSFGRPLDSEKKGGNVSIDTAAALASPTMSPIYPVSPISPVSPVTPITKPEQAGILPDPSESRNGSLVGGASPVKQQQQQQHAIPTKERGAGFGGVRSDSTTLGPIPEAGDVSRRHETIDLFEGDEVDDPYHVPKRTRRKGDNDLFLD